MSSLLTRTIDYEETPTQEDFSRFHVRSGGVAGSYFTETRHPPGYRIPRHAHEMTSLYLVLRGSLTEQFDRENVERKTDELIFTPPDVPHSNVFLGRGGSCLIVELNPAIISRTLECGKLPSSLTSFRGQPAWLAKRLYKEFCCSDAFSPLVVEGLVLEIVGAMCRQTPRRGSMGPQRKISQARERLDASFSESISLCDIARAVDIHPVYLARMFRQTYQCSVGEYLRLRRVGFACCQLSASDRPLSEIASEAGFCDQAHFTRTFHRLTGLTPGQYRAARRR
jgi:AraC family transcriptional regulator